MSVTTTKLEDEIMASIQSAVDRLKDEIAASAVKEFDREVRKIIGNASINMANYFSVQRLATDLVITVKMEPRKEPA